MAQVSEQLINDHAALDKVLKELQTALRSGDLEIAHTKLDLFWARLAVHIRAEHLHLFPTVLGSLENAAVRQASAPSLDEAKTVVAQLRQDHDFFMHQLALAVEIMRELLTLSEQLVAPEGLNNVKKIILEVEQRLVNHNEAEESQIYRWATTLLNSEEQAKLANQLTTELGKHPPRFTRSTWLDE
jgi:hemerythrin superfamily protein